MTKTTESWIKKIEPILREELALQSRGWIPPFDFPLFSSTLSKALSLDGLKIEAGSIEWKPVEHVTLGFGASPCAYAFECPLIKGPFYWIVADRDLARITEWLEPKQFLPKELARGLYEYVLLEGLEALQATAHFKPFSCQIHHKPLPEHGALYSIDISIQYQEEVLWCRLALTLEALTSIEKHFAKADITLKSLEEFPYLPLTFYLSAGFVHLTEKEFEKLNPGDFVVLDKSFFRPKSQKGLFQFTLNDTGLFQVKIKDDQMKILDFTYYAEENAMDNYPPLDDDDELADEQPFLDDDDDDLPEETGKIEDTAIEKMKLKDVPLTFHVEVKRLKMTLAELHKLAPGQSIPLGSHGPMNLVHLTLHGQAVAEGELLEISENVIGVKLSKIYK